MVYYGTWFTPTDSDAKENIQCKKYYGLSSRVIGLIYGYSNFTRGTSTFIVETNHTVLRIDFFKQMNL